MSTLSHNTSVPLSAKECKRDLRRHVELGRARWDVDDLLSAAQQMRSAPPAGGK
jgi:hypothetical protein